MGSLNPPIHTSCCNEAVIDIDQMEIHELPKSLQERLKFFLAPLQKLVFYPYARIDCGSMQVLTHIKNEDNKLILRLEHKSNIKMNDQYGFGTEVVSSLFQTDSPQKGPGEPRDGSSNGRMMKFSDERGSLIFSSVAVKDVTKVICDKEVLGTINVKALKFLSTPNLIATNEKGEIIMEIRINDPTSSVLTKPRNHIMIYSHGDEIVGKISMDASQQGSRFSVTFLKEDLDSSTKAVVLTASFLVYSKIVSRPRSLGHQNEEGKQCCLPDWSFGKSIPVVVITIAMTVLVTVAFAFTA